MTDNAPRPEWDFRDMTLAAVAIALALLLIGLLTQGCSPKVVEKIQVEYRDTTIIKETVRDSLIRVPIPLEDWQVVVDVSEVSHLETSVAESDAFVGRDGRLHHSLSNKRDSLAAIVPIHYHHTYTAASSQTTHTLVREVKVEKPLSKWQSFRLRAFPWLLGLLAAAGLWTFRKPIIKLLKI